MAFELLCSSQSCKIPRFMTSSSGTLTRVHNLKYMSCWNDSKETIDIIELDQGRMFTSSVNKTLKRTRSKADFLWGQVGILDLEEASLRNSAWFEMSHTPKLKPEQQKNSHA